MMAPAPQIVAAIVAWAVAAGLQVLVFEYLRPYRPERGLSWSRRTNRRRSYWLRGTVLALVRHLALCHGILVVERKPCLDPSSLPALQPSRREVLARWARLPEPLPLRALWLDGRGEHRGGPEPDAEVGSELPGSFRSGEAGRCTKSPPEGGRSREPRGLTGNGGGERQTGAGCPCGRMP